MQYRVSSVASPYVFWTRTLPSFAIAYWQDGNSPSSISRWTRVSNAAKRSGTRPPAVMLSTSMVMSPPQGSVGLQTDRKRLQPAQRERLAPFELVRRERELGGPAQELRDRDAALEPRQRRT